MFDAVFFITLLVTIHEMDKVLRPDKLEVHAQTPDTAAIYEFWERSLKNLIQSSFAEPTEEEKLFVLIQYLT